MLRPPSTPRRTPRRTRPGRPAARKQAATTRCVRRGPATIVTSTPRVANPRLQPLHTAPQVGWMVVTRETKSGRVSRLPAHTPAHMLPAVRAQRACRLTGASTRSTTGRTACVLARASRRSSSSRRATSSWRRARQVPASSSPPRASATPSSPPPAPTLTGHRRSDGPAGAEEMAELAVPVDALADVSGEESDGE